jgi:CRP-like cAMP-binding protein
MATDPAAPRGGENRLFSALPADVSERLRPHLEVVDLALRQSLYKPDEPITHVYFPCTAVCSLVLTLDDHTLIEIATVGREGMVGLPSFLGVDSIPGEAFCQVAGRALRLPADVLRQEVRDHGTLRDLLQRYTQAHINQIAQSAACSRAHSIDERCARWLLITHDQVGADQFTLTQQFLAMMLGVRRAGVNAAASILQRAGYIRYSRGAITITDRPGLESASCSCYRVVRDEFERLLG